MAIQLLRTENFRNLKNQVFEFSPHLNVISGANASGKTSLLEALYFLCVGKSFRTRRFEKLVTNNEDKDFFLLFGKVTHTNQTGLTIGIKRQIKSRPIIKVSGNLVRTNAELANVQPVLIIDPTTHEIITGSASTRRKFLDWGVFHVEHSFPEIWSKYINCIKQRNSLLRDGRINDVLIQPWTNQILVMSEAIHKYRSHYLEHFLPLLQEEIANFGFSMNCSVSYDRGWADSKTLETVMNEQLVNDKKKKFTQYGPHKADLKLIVDGVFAGEKLSRGQLKVMASCMVLAQVRLLHKIQQSKSVLLLDDISAELDNNNQALLLSRVKELDVQVFYTQLECSGSIDRKKFDTFDEYQMFHVEHGEFSRITINED